MGEKCDGMSRYSLRHTKERPSTVQRDSSQNGPASWSITGLGSLVPADGQSTGCLPWSLSPSSACAAHSHASRLYTCPINPDPGIQVLPPLCSSYTTQGKQLAFRMSRPIQTALGSILLAPASGSFWCTTGYQDGRESCFRARDPMLYVSTWSRSRKPSPLSISNPSLSYSMNNFLGLTHPPTLPILHPTQPSLHK